ncbi:MAG TPA: preprotein translocase subunit SecE [Gammaproteobacteria bacterium]|nr:preprotein translocase subunit SecE [Gammaproteobacteria bacterium]
MNARVDTQGSKLDSFKLTVALVLLAAGVGAFYYFADQVLVVRVIGLLVVAGISVLISSQTATGRRAWRFVQDARTEVRKVVWPTRSETTQTTLVVVVMVIAMGVLLWLLDMFLLWAVRLLTGHGG